MAQPSVAREPSMEEILASIRRIIESNDPVNGGNPSQEASTRFEEQDAGDADSAYDGGDFVAANDAGPSFPMLQRELPQAELPPHREPAQPAAAEATRSVSLADLAARVRSASDRMERPVQQQAPTISAAPVQVTVTQPRREMPSVAEEQPRAPAPMMAARLSEMRDQQLRPSLTTGSSQPVVQPAMPGVERAEDPASPLVMARMASLEVQVDRKEPTFLDAPMEREYPATDERVEPTMASLELRHEPEHESRDLTALVSAATVEQVSRSFSELAAAFDGTERRSLDEMAEEMLRPMLKDWLDDNLPTLVERLVREEIERVARGPRR